MSKAQKIQSSIWWTVRPFLVLARRMFSALFENLPPAFSDTVEPALRVFEAQADEIQHRAVGTVSLPQSHGHKRSRSAKRGSRLERDK